MTSLVDAHCHLDLYPRPGDVLSDAIAAQATVLAVTNAPSVFRASERLAAAFDSCFVALGLHPELAAEREHELRLFEALLPRTRFVGEVGLDYSYCGLAERRQQSRVFEGIVRLCSDKPDKVLSVHSRGAETEVIEMVGESLAHRVILHYFTGGRRVLQRAISLGFSFSVNPAMVRTKSGRATIQAIPRERLLTESDGPFVKVNRRGARPTDVVHVVAHLARLWDCDCEAVQAVLCSNFNRLVGEAA